MDRADSLPTDLVECHRLLLAAYKQAVQLERRATESERRATESQQRIAELDRVLDATSASYEDLQHEHASMLEELAWYKRWVHGRRRERIVEAQSQQHLFDLTPSGAVEAPAPLDSRAATPRDCGPFSPSFPPTRTGSVQSTAPSARARFAGRGEDLQRLPAREGPDRRRGDQGSRIRPVEAGSARARAAEVRMPLLQRWGVESSAPGTADCARHRRSRSDRANRRQQV